MKLEIKKNTYCIFDLDDTLYKEIDYLKSAFNHIASILKKNIDHSILDEMLSLYRNGDDVFAVIIKKYKNIDYSKNDLIRIYRNHIPCINLDEIVRNKLILLKEQCGGLGLITDGRSITQRNKLSALKIEKFFDDIIISEEFGSSKPCILNYQYYINKYPESKFIYFGDNLKKDFLIPNQLGWKSVCIIDDGRNIHKQNLRLKRGYLPLYYINSFSELEIINSEANYESIFIRS